MQARSAPPVSMPSPVRRGSDQAGPTGARRPSPGTAWHQIALAQAAGDAYLLAEAAQGLARLCAHRHDLEEAHWHLGRARAALAATPPSEQGLVLQCNWVGLAVTLSERWQSRGERAAARRLADEARDLCFEVARRSAGIDNVACSVSALLRIAEMLEALGDDADAQRMRMRAFKGVLQGSAIAA